MFEAKKSAWFEFIFSLYNRNLIWRRFSAFNVAGLKEFENRDKTIPIIVYANHSSWWDGLIAFQLCKFLKSDAYSMMEEKNFLKHRFHQKIGAFSVIRENPRDAVKSINYAVKMLREKENRLLWIFPQGEIQANDIRPLHFFNGLGRIVEKVGKCYTVPIALRYEQRGEFKPEIFVKIGAPALIETTKNINSKDLTVEFTKLLTENLDQIKTDISINNLEHYQNLLLP